MPENPYVSPSSKIELSEFESQHETTTRPVGVSILAVLHLLGGVVLFGMQFWLYAKLGDLEGALRSIGITPIMVILGVMFLSVITIGSGVGIWIGAKWGWWLASFYYIYSVFRNASTILAVLAMSDQLQGEDRGVAYYIIKHGGRIVVHSLLFMYFFKSNVLAFFGLENLSKAKAVGILISICIGFMVVMSAIGLAMN